MAYATKAQIESEFKDVTFSATSPVTTDDVTRFIEEADAEIDGYLGQKFVVPITGSESLKVVRHISILMVTGRIKEILRVVSGDKNVDQETRGGTLRKQAMDMLKDILSSKIKLSDATLVSSSNGVSSFAVEQSLEHTFQRGVDQW